MQQLSLCRRYRLQCLAKSLNIVCIPEQINLITATALSVGFQTATYFKPHHKRNLLRLHDLKYNAFVVLKMHLHNFSFLGICINQSRVQEIVQSIVIHRCSITLRAIKMKVVLVLVLLSGSICFSTARFIPKDWTSRLNKYKCK